MAELKLTQKPTNGRDYAYSDPAKLTRAEFTKLYPLGETTVVTTIGKTIAGLVPKVGWIASLTDAFVSLTSVNKKAMVNDVYTALANHPGYNNVFVCAKFNAYEKGNQGLFWLPADGYRVFYS